MNIYKRKKRWKVLLLFAALLIGILSLWYTNKLVSELSLEEKQKVVFWSEAMKRLGNSSGDLSFELEIVKENTTVPIILTDSNHVILNFRNLDSTLSSHPEYLQKQLSIMKSQHDPIVIIQYVDDDPSNPILGKYYIYYKDSILLKKLRYYPYLQLGVIGLFLAVSYLAFNRSRKAEQNQVWIGLAKETAHQLGTPLSSLIAWLEYLKLKGYPQDMTSEIEKDIQRLNTITERFSKIGSMPVLKRHDVIPVIQNTLDYIQSRASNKINFSLTNRTGKAIHANINIPLFEWVIENLCKNAIDSIKGAGSISVVLNIQNYHTILIDVKDSGKGIPKNKFKTVFNPGFTTKNRGWGLGLTLAKRIVEEYHSGTIFVKESEHNKGTTFRIILKTA
jgi:anti-sigma regulatory factor (Ser/Thr protein kinase)